MIQMLDHDLNYIAGLQAERRAEAARHRPPSDPGELERTLIAARSGDQTALAALVDRFAARVRAVARRHRLPRHDAEDAVQRTWLRLLERVDAIREPSAVGAWLETTARRECLSLLRDRKRECPADDALFAERSCAAKDEQRLVRAEQAAALAGAVERLPSRQRQLTTMLLSDPELSYSEIAEALDMPIGSIGPTRARSLDNLRADSALVRALRP